MTTEQVILSAILTLTASILTAFLTSKITRDNEMRKIIHQKRLELYLEVFEQVELLFQRIVSDMLISKGLCVG